MFRFYDTGLCMTWRRQERRVTCHLWFRVRRGLLITQDTKEKAQNKRIARGENKMGEI